MVNHKPNNRKRHYLLKKAASRAKGLIKKRARDVQQTAERTQSTDTEAITSVEQSMVQLTGDAVELTAQVGKGVYNSYKNQKHRRKRLKIHKRRRPQKKGRANPTAKPTVKSEKPITPSGESLRIQRIKQTRKQQMIKTSVNRYLAKKNPYNSLLRYPLSIIRTTPVHGSWKQQMQRGAIAALKRLAEKLQKAFVALARTAVQSLIGLLGAGWVVLLLLLIIGAVAALVGSPMGILFADESQDAKSIRIAAIVQETNQEFVRAINERIAEYHDANQVDLQYAYPEGTSWTSNWPEVLALFAVDANLRSDTDVVVIDQIKKQQIQAVFWEMHNIESELEEREVITSEPEEDTEIEPSPSPAVAQESILHITVRSKSVEELASGKNFTQEQMELLHQLLSQEMRPALVALCGSLTAPGAGVGILQWPLPGYTTITTLFGASDAFGNPGHKGIDIAAPENTPILAAQDGTVVLSNWNDSYGNQVVIQGLDGISTRYAHMIVTAVSMGDTVTAGQVIGYVGSTGDSTGNHLHLEVLNEGRLVNPLDYLCYYTLHCQMDGIQN